MTAYEADIQDILLDQTDDELEDFVIATEPFIGMVPKSTDGGGLKRRLPFSFAPTSGVSQTFADAQAAKGPSSFEQWEVTWKDLFSLFSIDHKAATLTQGDAKAFVELVEAESESSLKAFRKVLNKLVWGNGGGALGQVQSGGGTTSIVLTDRADMAVWHKNNQLVSSTDDGWNDNGAVAGLASASPYTLSAVNRQTRTLTSGSTFDGTELANDNFVFLRGGYNNSIHGVDAWNPTTAPTSATFNGVNRTVDSSMYGVIRTGDKSVDSTLTKFAMSLIADVAMESDEVVDALFCNHLVLNLIIKHLDSKTTYESITTRGVRADGNEATAGYSGVKIITEWGPVTFYGSRNCPMNVIRAIRWNTWLLETVKYPLGSFLTYFDDADKFARHSEQNAAEARRGNYLNLMCSHPGGNGVGLIDTYISGLINT